MMEFNRKWLILTFTNKYAILIGSRRRASILFFTIAYVTLTGFSLVRRACAIGKNNSRKNMKNEQSGQQARPLVVVLTLVVFIALIIVVAFAKKPKAAAQPVDVSVSNATPASSAHEPDVAQVPMASVAKNDSTDGVPAVTTEALEKAGLSGVQFTKLSLTTKPRPPIVIHPVNK
jgi:hypothetical protein